MLATKHSVKKEIMELALYNNNKLYCTPDHKILTEKGYENAERIEESKASCYVDTRNGQLFNRKLPNKVFKDYRGRNGFSGKPSVFKDGTARTFKGQKNCKTATLESNRKMDHRRISLFCRDSRRGGYNFLSSHNRKIREFALTTQHSNHQHIIGAYAIHGKHRNDGYNQEKYKQQVVLVGMDKRFSVSRSNRKNTAFFADQTPARRYFDGNNIDKVSTETVRFADSTHHGLISRIKGFEPQRIKSFRRLEESRLVVDITTTQQCFIAGTFVVHNCDHAINHIIKDSGFLLPKGGLLDPQFRDMSADAIYSKLPEPPKNGQGNGKGKGSGPATGQAGKPESGDNPDPGGCGAVMDFPGETGKATPAELAQQAQDWQIAATQAAQVAKAQGKLPGSLSRLIEELNDAKVPWREVLQRFVNQCARNDYSWRRPSARYFSRGIILPSLYSEQLPPIVVAVDTSGSISQADLQQFASEIDEIVGQYNATVNVLYCDSMIAGEEEFTPETRPVRLHAKGGGGTDFAPVFKHVEAMPDSPACIVYLTDMCCSSFGDDPGCPVLWVATEGKKHKVPFGGVTYLN